MINEAKRKIETLTKALRYAEQRLDQAVEDDNSLDASFWFNEYNRIAKQHKKAIQEIG